MTVTYSLENHPDKIIVHHTANPNMGPQFADVNLLHKERFDTISSLGFYMAYHLFIEKDGTVIRARQDFESGPHTKGHNFDAIAICLAGNFDFQAPTAMQIKALCGQIDSELAANKLNADRIYPHRSFVATSCYGITLSDSWAKDTYDQFLNSKLFNIVLALKNLIAQLTYKLIHGNKT